MQHFYVAPGTVGTGVFALPAHLVHQLQRVLRSRPGDHIVLFDGSGEAYEVVLRDFDHQSITAKVVHRWQPESEPPVAVTLYQSPPKGRRWEWLLQKGTELGVMRFAPISTRHSVVRGGGNLERWRDIVREAAEQSRRVRLPEIVPQVTFAEAVGALPKGAFALIACLDERAGSLQDALTGFEASDGREVALFVGPEGGFCRKEIDRAIEHGLMPVSLGPRVLRAETAPLALLAVIMARIEAW